MSEALVNSVRDRLAAKCPRLRRVEGAVDAAEDVTARARAAYPMGLVLSGGLSCEDGGKAATIGDVSQKVFGRVVVALLVENRRSAWDGWQQVAGLQDDVQAALLGWSPDGDAAAEGWAPLRLVEAAPVRPEDGSPAGGAEMVFLSYRVARPALIDDTVYDVVIGGGWGQSDLDAWIAPGEDWSAWERVAAGANSPGVLRGARAEVLGGVGYVLGGFDLSAGVATSAVWRTVNGRDWSRLPDAPWAARTLHVSFVLGGRLYVGGGIPAGGVSDGLEDLWWTEDGVNWTLDASFTWESDSGFCPRVFTGCAAGGGRAFFCGGTWEGVEPGEQLNNDVNTTDAFLWGGDEGEFLRGFDGANLGWGQSVAYDDALDRFVVWSGFSGESISQPVSKLKYYAAVSGWSEDLEVPVDRHYWGALLSPARGRLILLGGRTSGGNVRGVWTRESSGAAWVRHADGPWQSRAGLWALALPRAA